MKSILRYFFFFLILLGTGSVQAQKKAKFKKISKGEKAQIAENAFAEAMKQYILGNFSEALAGIEECRRIGADNAALNYVTAKIHLTKEKTDLALHYANKALKLDNKNKYYYLLVAEIYQRRMNYSEAVKTYKKLLAEVPNSDEYFYNLAEIYFFQKNYDEALKTYIKIENSFGKSLQITQRKQEIYSRSGKFEMAKEEAEALIKAFPEDNEYKVSYAEFLFKNKLNDEAIAVLEKAIKEEPDNAYARLLLSDIYQMQGKREKSDEELESVFNNPETALHTKLSIIEGYLRAKETDYNKAKAIKLAETTIKFHPNEAKAYFIYGEALLKSGKKEEAWQNFIKATQLDNANFNLWIQVVALDSDLDKTDSLIKHTEAALEIFPNQAILWLYNGLGYSMKKNYSKSIELLEEGKKLSAGNNELLIQFNMQLGDNYHYFKDYKKSDEAYEEVLKIDGANDHALNNYSYFLSLRKDKLELAKSMSEKLVKKYPNSPTYLDTYAWVLYQMKNYEEAKKYLETAIKNSDNGTIVEHYGDVLYQLGKTDAAIEQWSKAKKLGDTSDLIDKKIKDKKLYE